MLQVPYDPTLDVGDSEPEVGNAEAESEVENANAEPEVGNVEAEGDVGRVERLDTAYRKLKNDYNFQTRQLRTARADKLRAEKAAKSCNTEKAQKARFFDRRLLHPVVSLPPNPWAIATLLATLIAIDRRTGQTRRPVPNLRFEKDKGLDLFSAPSETNQARVGDCAKFVRQDGAFRGKAVGCARVPGGFHVWLQGENGEILDSCVDRGMAPVPASVYRSGVYVAIAQIQSPALGRVPATDFGFGDDLAEMESMYDLPWDEMLPFPTMEDADADIFGFDVVDENVDGSTGDAFASLVGVAGAIGSVLATAYGGPAAGAAVATVAQATAGAISAIDQDVPKNLPPKQRRRAVAQAARRNLAAAKNSTTKATKRGLRFDVTAVAMVAATSEDPAVIKKVRDRLATPREHDPNPQYRMALEACVIGLRKSGHTLPMSIQDEPEYEEPEPDTVAGYNQILPDIFESVDGIEEDLLDFVPACPGTCAV